MKKVTINNKEYIVEKDDNDIFNLEEIQEKITDYFDNYDYILGDIAYNKVRLKGFYASNNKNKNDINDIKNLDSYIKDYCAYGCKYFLLKKVQ